MLRTCPNEDAQSGAASLELPVISGRAERGRKRGAQRPASLDVTHLSDRELLALALEVTGSQGADHQAASDALLAVSGGLGGLGARLHLELDVARPPFTTPISGSQLWRLAALLELGRRAFRTPVVGRKLTSHRDVQRWAAGHLVGLEHEEVWVLALRGNRRVDAEWCVARGGLHGCGLLPADVLRPVLRCAASAFILVHNHPSGDPTPSRDDVAMTRALAQACSAVGLTLIDHVIVSRGGSYSLAEACLIGSQGHWETPG